MANPVEPEIQEYVERLIAATRSGEIKWVAANPTTYSWDTSPGVPQRAKLTLQRVEKQEPPSIQQGRVVTRVTRTYVLQALELTPTTTITRATINSAEYPALNEQMASLFDWIASEKKRQELDFLKSVFPKS